MDDSNYQVVSEFAKFKYDIEGGGEVLKEFEKALPDTIRIEIDIDDEVFPWSLDDCGMIVIILDTKIEQDNVSSELAFTLQDFLTDKHKKATKLIIYTLYMNAMREFLGRHSLRFNPYQQNEAERIMGDHGQENI